MPNQTNPPKQESIEPYSGPKTIRRYAWSPSDFIPIFGLGYVGNADFSKMEMIFDRIGVQTESERFDDTFNAGGYGLVPIRSYASLSVHSDNVKADLFSRTSVTHITANEITKKDKKIIKIIEEYYPRKTPYKHVRTLRRIGTLGTATGLLLLYLFSR